MKKQLHIKPTLNPHTGEYHLPSAKPEDLFLKKTVTLRKAIRPILKKTVAFRESGRPNL